MMINIPEFTGHNELSFMEQPAWGDMHHHMYPLVDAHHDIDFMNLNAEPESLSSGNLDIEGLYGRMP